VRRFFSLLVILSLVNPTPGAWADELRPIQEGSQHTGLEQQMLQAGAEEGISVYLDPKVKNGRLVEPGNPFQVAQEMNRWLWDKPEVKAAKVVALSNIKTTGRKKGGKAQFALSGLRYGITLNYNAASPQRLLVLADPKTQLPVSAYSIPGGELVYSVSEQIQVFLDGTVKDGRLMGSPSPYRLLQMVPAALWEEKAVQNAKTVVLTNVPTGKRDDIFSFHMAGQGYPTTLDYVPGETPPRLLVVMDPKARTPSAAYEMKTGKQVFPGSNQMRVYLDPKIERGKLAGNPAPLLITGKATASFWENKEFQGASNLVFADVPTRKSANKENQKNMAVFSVKGKGYTITKAFDPQHPPRLLVVVDLKSQEPTTAYDMETGEQVFSTAERIPVYLNPRIKAGRLVGKPEPFALMTRNLVGLLEKGEVKRAAMVALGNIPTKRSTVGKSETSAAFGLAGETYVINRKFDPDQDLRLLVVVDPSTGFPREAYDFSTGERVFSAKDLIQVYINPSVRNGRLAGDGRPFRIARTVSGKVWNQREIREAETVALSNVSTIHVAGTATFFVDTRGYPTRRKYDAEHPFRLLVIVNPATRVPTVAYDLSTGEEVFSAGDLVQIYLDPRIEKGRFSEGEKPFQLLQIPRLTATFWSKPEVEQATTLALANVQASNLRGTAGFYLGNTGYRTTRRFDADHPLRLIIHEQIDPWLPIVAYDMATGERVYPVPEKTPPDARLEALASLAEDESAQAGAEEKISIYLDPKIEKGRVAGKPTAFQVLEAIPAKFWDRPEVAKAGSIVFQNYPTFDVGGKATFRFGLYKRLMYTQRPFDPRRPLRLTLVVDGRTRVPLVAYDSETGNQVYSPDFVKAHLNPELEKGRVKGNPIPFDLTERQFTDAFWNKKQVQRVAVVALENVSTRSSAKGTTVFSVAGSTYHTTASYDANSPLRLLVLMDPKRRVPTAAYSQSTGEVVYSAADQLQVYLDPPLQGGKIPDTLKPYRTVRIFLRSLLGHPQIKKSKVVALANVPTRKAGGKGGNAAFSFGKRSYSTTRSYDPKNPPRLLLLIDPRERQPVAAHDLFTGEEVYSRDSLIRVYLDPLIKNGRMTGDPEPFLSVKKIPDNFWEDKEILGAKRVVFENVRAYDQGKAAFSVTGKRYYADRLFDPAHPLYLRVVVEPKTRMVLAAYDAATGEEVYSPSSRMGVYLDQDPNPFRVLDVVPGSFWGLPEVQRASRVVLDNVLTYSKGDWAAFSLAGDSFSTAWRVEAGYLPRLRVTVDPRTKKPVTAHEMATGRPVYPPSYLMEVYADPEIVRGRLKAGLRPVKTLPKRLYSTFWEEPIIRDASRVAVTNYPTHVSGDVISFNLAQKRYMTSRRFKPGDEPIRLLLVVDPKSKRPVAAYEEGEQVYPPADFIQVYLNPEIREGRLTAPADPFRAIGAVTEHFWKEVNVRQAETVGFSNVIAYREYKKLIFKLGNKPYTTSRPYDPEHPLRLLVTADPKIKRPTAAYDLETGEQVYPAPQQPGISADDRLAALTDLAGDEPDQAGAEEISLYLNSRIEDGRRIGGGEPFYAGRYITGDVWDKPEVRRAKTVVLENVPGIKQGDKFAFNLAAELYLTDLSFNPGKDLRLRILVDPETKLPSEAWDQATGEKVYSAEDLLGVYLDPVLQGGRLAGDSRPFRNLRVIPAGIWDDSAVKTAKRIGIANYPMNRKRGIPRITLARQTYKIEGSFDPNKPPKLFVLIDPKLKRVLAIYDMDTGERLLSKEAIGLYLNPVIENGRLATDSRPFMGLVMGKLTNVFKRKEIQAASAIAFHNFPTRPKKGMAYFNIGGVSYPTGERYDPQSPLRLLVLLDPKSQVPTEAYDLTTGKLLFAGKDYVRIYVDPFIEEGRIKTGTVPDLLVREPRGSLWQRPELRLARKTVGLLGISTYRQRDVAGFNFLDLRYRTTLAYSEKNPPKLLVLVDIQSKLPAEAYDLETGKKVFSAADHIQVFLNPKIENGRLAEGAVPFRLAQRVYNSLRKEIERERPKTVALTNVPTREGPHGAEFSMLGRTYLTSRSINTGAPLRLSVLISARNWNEPVAAYDMATGEQVYPAEGMLAAYLDPEMKNGQVVGGQKLFLRRRQLRSVMWDRASEKGAQFLVVENVKTHNKNGRTVFHLIEEIDLLTSRKFNPRVSLKLVAVGSVKDRRVIAAYDMATGEQVYPAPPQPADERLGALADLAEQAGAEEILIYSKGKIADGKLMGAGEPVWRGLHPIKSKFWDDERFSGSSRLMLENIGTFDHHGRLYFAWQGRTYSTGRPASKETTLRLWVSVSYPGAEVMEAWDMETGSRVYSAGGLIKVYRKGRIEAEKLVGAGVPIWEGERARKSSFWADARLKRSNYVMLENINTHVGQGRALFSWQSRPYSTDRLFDENNPLRLWVKIAYPGGKVLDAWDMATGEQVYSASGMMIRVYGKGAIQGNKLMENGELIWEGKYAAKSNFWDDARLANSSYLMLENVPTSPRGKRTYFSLQKQGYYTGRLFDENNPMRLWVKVSYPEGNVLEAWDMASGDQVYPAVRGKGDPRLADLTILAEDETQAGAEEKISMYLDPEIQNGRLVGNPVPIAQKKTVHSSLWQKDEVRRSRRVVLAHVPVTDKGSGSATFYIAQQHYLAAPVSKQATSLLVVVDPVKVVPISAFDEATGERVYPPVSFKVKLFLNVQIRDGRLEGDPEPAGIFKRVSLKDPRIPDSESVVFSGVPTFRAHGTATFQVSKRHYLTTRSFDSEHPLVLLLELDPATRRPLAAYDLANGERVFLESDLLQVYLDAEVVDGRLVGSPNPYRLFHSVPSAFFANPAVRQMGQVVLANVPTHKDGSGLSRFSLAGRTYKTPRAYDLKSPLKLIAVVNPKTTRVTAAYDMGSGEKVYSEENLIHIYLSPSLKDGRLEGDPLPDEVTARISDTFWKDPQVRQAKTVVFTGVVASPKGKTAVFYLNRQPYWTSRQADPENSLRLLVQANPRTRIPLAAYDMETGEQVYPVQELVQVYLDPPLNNGLLTGDPTPFRTVRSITADLWALPEVSRSKAVAFADVRAGSAYGWATFFIAQHSYQTDRRFDQSHPLKLLVLVDPRNRLPSAAYDMQTGKKIFPPAGRSIEVYVDPEIQDGKLQEDSLPVWRLKVFKFALLKKSQVQQADTLGIKGVPVFYSNGRAGFQVGKTSFYTRFPLDPKQSEKLLVVINPKEPLPPRAAYLVRTGEQIYPALFPLVDLSADYVVSRIQLSADFVSGESFYRKRLSQAIEEAVRGDLSLAEVTLSLGGEKLPLTLKKYPQGPVVWTLARDQGHPESPPEALIRVAQAFGFVRRQSPPADTRLEALTDLAAEQAGAEELAAHVVEGWQAEEGTNAVVLSSSLLNQPYAEGLKTALRNLPPELAKRVYLAGNWEGLKEANRHLKVIPNGSADDVAVAVGQQVPAPEKVWLVGEFAPVYGWMLKQMGLEPEKISSGADIQEFLAQLGILLGVPEAQIQSGVEELRQAEQGVEAEA